MTSRDFCFWLQGFFELARTDTISETQAGMIQRHLALVFKHEIDPAMGAPAQQTELSTIHNPPWATTAQALPHDPNVLIRC